MSTARVVVVGCGARTSVGLHAAATAAAVRAGVAQFGQHPFMVDTAGRPMIVARVPDLDLGLMGGERLAYMVDATIAEAIGDLPATLVQRAAVPTFIGMPAWSIETDRERVVKAARRAMSSAGLMSGSVETLVGGHASGSRAIEGAWRAIRSGACDLALAGGVDTHLIPEWLERLEAADQLNASGYHNNPYGFVPGEGCGFVLLAAEATAAQAGVEAVLAVDAVASTIEEARIGSTEICTGIGLTALFEGLAATGHRVDQLYCDINGEPYRSDEFGFASIRRGDLFRDPSAFDAPADCWGDVGSASGPLFLVLAAASVGKGYAAGPVIAAFTGSEDGARCGFVASRLGDC